MTKKNIKGIFERILKNFHSNPNPKIKNKSKTLESRISHSVDFIIDLPDKLKIHHPYIVFIIFVTLKNY